MKEKIVYYNKLIRDKVLQNIKKAGAKLKAYKLTVKRFEIELLKKVGEEADGLLAAKNKQELITELADVQDVIDEIKKVKKISNKELKRAQKQNQKRKGGFKKRLFLVWSSDNGY